MDKALDTPDIAAARAGRGLDFRKDINGLRALAVLGVVAFHADRALVPGGFAGVDVFFVISGFLISRIILSECAAGRFSLPMFYAKRARRILPAMLAVVCCVWIVGWFRAAPTQFRDIGGGLLGNSYFTVNFWLLRLAGVGGYFGADSSTKPLLHLWSLSIEEQFYLVWSVLLLAIFGLRQSLLPAVIVGILLASLATCVILTPIDPIGAFYLPWTRAWELALGALIAYREVFLLEALPYPARKAANIGAGLGVALMLGAFFLMSEVEPFPGWRATIPTAGCALVIAHPRSWIGDVALGNRVAGFFGVISYPLYLWHWPLFAFAHTWPGVIPTPAVMLALAGVAVGLATLTYLLIEAPVAAAFRHRPFGIALALAAALAATGVVGRITYDTKGFPGRFPPLVARIFDYDVNGAQGKHLMQCFYQRDDRAYPLEEERERAARFFEDNRCGEPDDPQQADDPCRRRFPCRASFRRPHGSVRRQGQHPDAVVRLLRAPGRACRDGRGRRRDAALPRHQRLCVRTHPGDQAGRSPGRGVFFAIRPRGELALSRLSRCAGRGRAAFASGRRSLDRDRRRSADLGSCSSDSGRARPPRARGGAGVLPHRRPAGFARQPTGRSPARIGAKASSTSRRRNSSAATTVVAAASVRTFPRTCLPSTTATISVNGSIFAVKTILAPVIEAEIARSRGQRQ